MNLSSKVTLLFSAIALGILAMLVAISLYAFRLFSISSSSAHVRTAAEVVRVHLTEAMIQGTIAHREQFLARLMEVQGLSMARVVRSPLVDQQFGAGLVRELPADEIEKAVLASGEPRYELREVNGDTLFRGTIPFVASSEGTPNCLQCHQVPEGAVLGAVTMEMSIADLKTRALMTVAGLVAVVALFAVLAIALVRRIIRPVGEAAREVEQAVQRALKGDFKSQIAAHTQDEIGQIANDTNRLLSYLDSGLERITQRVVQLTGRNPRQDENKLEATIDMVNSLADAAAFKQAIEEDETKSEIYDRFGQILTERFGINTYSIYEVADGKQMTTMLVDGEAGGACRWCDPQILVRSETCRAKRSGHPVDAIAQPGICYAFSDASDDGQPRSHYCVPIIQSGSVGSVIQLVVPASDTRRLQEVAPFIHVYVREMAPVLETKRLTETLRESSLRDAMTGLNNRRFLEEYVDTLIASTRRRQVSLAIMLLDLDYFKVVNDTYGHDAGDTVLKALASVLRQSVRASDMVIRFGGEEFLIVLQEATEEGALKVAENIRRAVEQMKIQVSGAVLQKTISIGLAMFPTDSETFWQTVKFADVALYRAKEAGRNRVVRFTADMWEGNSETY